MSIFTSKRFPKEWQNAIEEEKHQQKQEQGKMKMKMKKIPLTQSSPARKKQVEFCPEHDTPTTLIELQTKSDPLLNIMNSQQSNIQTKVLVASETGNYRVLYALLHQEIDPNKCVGLNGYTALHHATSRGHLEITQLLCQFGANINRINKDGESPLHLAAYNGNVNIVELLLDKGAFADAVSREHETPVFYAARKGHNRVVRMLKRRGADLTIKNAYGDTAEEEVIDLETKQEFRADDITSIQDIEIGQEEVRRCFEFLDAKALCRASQVCDRWLRVADDPSLWNKLGVSRWEMIVQSKLGHGFVAPMASYRPSSRSSMKNKGYATNHSIIHGNNNSNSQARPSTRDNSFLSSSQYTDRNTLQDEEVILHHRLISRPATAEASRFRRHHPQ